MQASPVQECSPDFKRRCVKHHLSRLQDHGILIQLRVIAVLYQLYHISVFHYHALGLSGGSRGIDTVDGTSGISRMLQLTGFSFKYRSIRKVDHGKLREVLPDSLLRLFCIINQNCLRAAVLYHETDSVLRISRIDGHVGSPGLHDSEDAQHNLKALSGNHCHKVLRFHAQILQLFRKASGLRIHLPVGQALFFKYNCCPLRRLPCLLFKQLRHGLILRILCSGIIECPEDQFLLPASGGSDFGNPHLRLLRHLFQHGYQMFCQLLRTLLLVQGSTVLNRNLVVFFLLSNAERQVEFRYSAPILFLLRLHSVQLQKCIFIILQHQHHIKQRIPGKVSLDLHCFHKLLERILLVFVCTQAAFLYLFKEFPETLFPFRLPPHRKRVDKHAEHAFRILMRSSADRRTDHDILLPAVLGQKHHRRCKEYHVRRSSALRCQHADPLSELLSALLHHNCPFIALLLRSCMIQRHVKYRYFILKLLLPVLCLG